MGQTVIRPVKIEGVEAENLLSEKEPPDPKPSCKSKMIYKKAKYTTIKYQEMCAGAHALIMISCVH